jgi:hypothetical protein
MSTFRIGRPNPGGGFDKEAHCDHLIAFIQPTAEEATTSFGDSTAARCSYVACLDCNTVMSDVLIFGSVLVPRLVGTDDDVVVTRLGKGLAKPGRSPAWIPDNPTDADISQVEAFLEKHATRLKSGAIVVETPEPQDERDDGF